MRRCAGRAVRVHAGRRLLVAVPDPTTWRLGSFRSVDPFRIHAYGLGAQVGESLACRLEERLGDDHVAWGRWLREELWAPGRRTTFNALEAQLGV